MDGRTEMEEKGPDTLANQADSFGAASHSRWKKNPLALHVGQLQLSAESGMQSAHTRDCIDTWCGLHNTAKSHTSSQSRQLALFFAGLCETLD